MKRIETVTNQLTDLGDRVRLHDHGLHADLLGASRIVGPYIARGDDDWRAHIISGSRGGGSGKFTPGLRVKDVDYALRLARKLGIGAPFGALANAAYIRLCELGHAHSNESRIIDVARLGKP